MNEFGSDFHYIEPGCLSPYTISSYYPSAHYYADGRQTLAHLYISQGWKRIWIPEYFCCEVITSWQKYGLNIATYSDCPECNDDSTILNLPYKEGDSVLRVNYFGIRDLRDNSAIPVPVAEDHTHDLIGNWPTNSNADWCIASLRKSLPIAEGGILWSPRNHALPELPPYSKNNETVAHRRWLAMSYKSNYLLGKQQNKDAFRRVFCDTEHYFTDAAISQLDSYTKEYLSHFDVKNWYRLKRQNWFCLSDIRSAIRTIIPEGLGCFPFSTIIMCRNEEHRNRLRLRLIENCVYPAVLWNVPPTASAHVRDFSKRMLSIHCDGRYSVSDIQQVKSIITSALAE